MLSLRTALSCLAATLVLGGCGLLDFLGGDDDGDVVYDGSRCKFEDDHLHCAHHTDTVWTGQVGVTPRVVHWQVPVGEAPADGWPVAILFQGSLISADTFWDADEGDAFGGYNQVLVVQTLLDAGFAVITPEARLAGSGAWETNIPPMANNWTSSGDHDFMRDIFAGIDGGDYGDCDRGRMFAAGISSGGYMTSRMDVAYRSRFRALAIQSASYATCAGTVCNVPDPLSGEHLPTLFLHGRDDLIVPIGTMLDYHDGLLDAGVETVMVIDEHAGHQWIDAAPDAILEWFESHLP